MHLYKVALGGFEQWMWADEGNLPPAYKTWTQQPQHWTMFFFESGGIMSVNNKPIPFQPGNVGFVTPGTKVAFDRVGDGTHHFRMTFGITPRTEVVAIPAIADLGEMTAVRRKEMRETFDWLSISIMRGLGCAFNLLWSISRPLDTFRKSDLVSEAEALIIERIAAKINVRSLADELAISHSHLLRLFRQEHSQTIQEYIRDKRVELACQMLTDSDMAIKEIAIRTGIPDLQYFNKIIRSSSGHSPTSLRAQALGRTRH